MSLGLVTTDEASLPPEPPVRWAGGKRRMLPRILPLLPKRIRTYAEPFIGGGAVFWQLAYAERFDKAVISDTNIALVQLYRVLRDDPDTFIARLERVTLSKSSYQAAQRAHNDAITNKVSDGSPHIGALDMAGGLALLNRGGYNGLWRVNKAGHHNVSFDPGRAGTGFPPSMLARYRACGAVLDGRTAIRLADFEKTLRPIMRFERGDAAYFDPPYYPVNGTSNFTGYALERFERVEHQRLARLANQLADRGTTVILTNSDVPDVWKLYAGWDIQVVPMLRSISCKGGGRGAVNELLISKNTA